MKKFFFILFCCFFIIFSACGKEANEGYPTEAVSGNHTPAPEATPTPPTGGEGTLPPATKIDGKIYWSDSRGQSDRFRVMEENYLGEILYYEPEGITEDSPDYSSEEFPVGVKVYRDVEDETVLWFVEYHEEDNYNEYSRGIWTEALTQRVTPPTVRPE